MKRKICLFALMLALLVSSLPLFTLSEMVSAATTQMQAAIAEAISMLEEEREEGVIVVFMKEGVTPEQAQELFISLDILSDLDDREICLSRNYDYFSTSKIRFTLAIPEERMVEILAELNLSEIVDSACPNYVIMLGDVENEQLEEAAPVAAAASSSSTTASYDPLTTQWAMEQVKYAGSLESSRTVLIGVLDSGYNPHADVDCVDMKLARNYKNEADLYNVTDDTGHGTFVIGEIGAAFNGIGVNGICKNAKIVPIKVAKGVPDENGKIIGRADLSAICNGMEYAEDQQIKVLNLSYLLLEHYSVQMKKANYTGVLVIAAGNFKDDVEGPCSGGDYIYGYNNTSSNWIIVGATTSSGSKWSWSNYSKKYVDLFAPGYSIRGIAPDGTSYKYQNGTSMAAPFVTAAAAILLGDNPFLSAKEVREKLINTVTKTSALSNYCVSGGILNINAATNSLYDDKREAYSLGDLDGDGMVTSTDYTMLKRYVLGTLTLDNNAKKAADINNDGTIDSTDYLLVSRFISRTTYFPPKHVD